MTRTGRPAGQVRQDVDESGWEHVAQSGAQHWQVPFEAIEFEGHESTHVPDVAKPEVHRVQVVAEPTQVAQVASQAKRLSDET